ncbi:MAG: hypothetical protein MHPSP_004593, partial [Paramarteilia canceri]
SFLNELMSTDDEPIEVSNSDSIEDELEPINEDGQLTQPHSKISKSNVNSQQCICCDHKNS